MVIIFSNPQASVFGYFTYLQQVTVSAFDAANHLLGRVTSNPACSSNLALSGTAGCPPNELLALAGVGNIVSVSITGSASGGSFTLDDLTLAAATSAVPEPATAFMAGGGLIAAMAAQWWFRRRG